jgi:hypothetical protein
MIGSFSHSFFLGRVLVFLFLCVRTVLIYFFTLALSPLSSAPQQSPFVVEINFFTAAMRIPLPLARVCKGGVSWTAARQFYTARAFSRRPLSTGGGGGGGGSSSSGGPVNPTRAGATNSASSTADPKKSAVESIIESTQGWNQSWNKTYADIESSIMERIHASNRQRFRVITLTAVIGVTWIIAVFGGKIKEMLTRQTADIAKETLENKSLQIQTQELATAVVQTVLNDKEVTARASAFVREAMSTPETRDALVALLVKISEHAETKAALSKLTKSIIADLSSDKVIRFDFGASKM